MRRRFYFLALTILICIFLVIFVYPFYLHELSVICLDRRVYSFYYSDINLENLLANLNIQMEKTRIKYVGPDKYSKQKLTICFDEDVSLYEMLNALNGMTGTKTIVNGDVITICPQDQNEHLGFELSEFNVDSKISIKWFKIIYCYWL